MQAILDHLTAILVGATLLGALLFIQMRQQQSAIETVVHDRAKTTTGTMFEIAHREIENARTREQSVRALGYYVMNIRGTADHTDQFTFVTSVPPPPGSITGGHLGAVSYRAVANGKTTRVGTDDMPTYTIERWVNRLPATSTTAPGDFTQAGVIATNVVRFVVKAYSKNGNMVNHAGTSGGTGRWGSTWSENDPVRFDIEIESAARGPEMKAGDQKATSAQNLVSLTQSIRPVNTGATGSSTVTTTPAVVRSIPLLPGETPPPPPAPPSPTPTPTPSPAPTPTPSPGPAPSPPPAPPPRPPAPPGIEI